MVSYFVHDVKMDADKVVIGKSPVGQQASLWAANPWYFCPGLLRNEGLNDGL